MSDKLNILEFRDLGGIDPKGETIQAIYENFETLFNAVNEINEKSCSKKAGRPKKDSADA